MAGINLAVSDIFLKGHVLGCPRISIVNSHLVEKLTRKFSIRREFVRQAACETGDVHEPWTRECVGIEAWCVARMVTLYHDDVRFLSAYTT